ncbi:hypothetical protein Isop_2930 [Isosphaera pallida ATCC 43644]|uniref:Tll0287-like domain-containing protein n=1 Tax=Isosphaera pallida (strain ATCC 43644 / DSM 9630 / IS1B) TaxID=575540 RepID=E8R265_ISOPI|nr:DUF3365 domain-containing protein [Isosphaera pallida]ADV63495.1 hypothetical protein Isop_2930 [Isosphaera pallida ATCC 43644]
MRGDFDHLVTTRHHARGLDLSPSQRSGWFPALVAVGLALAGCGDSTISRSSDPSFLSASQAAVQGKEEESWKTVPVQELAGPALASWERAAAARDQLAGRLLSRVQEAIAQEGPAGAIAVCQTDAPTIARQVADETGVLIGRTALKLRNPANAPPHWAKTVLATTPPETPWVSVNNVGTIRGLWPIRLQATCLTCHGPVESLGEEVRSALGRSYPADRAVGFAEGDLRGWFWVEATPPGSAPPGSSAPKRGTAATDKG